MNITNKLWSFCHILRHDGMDYADYVEQLTYLLFLKMADESDINVPPDCQWKKLVQNSGKDLINIYDNALNTLKHEKGLLGRIFQEPISKIKNPDNLKKIVLGIEEIGWTQLERDVQGEAFEGLLERTANEGKKGAGQFFTPRPLIQAIVNVMQPNPLESKNFKIGDVACGTAGFLTVAAEWAKNKLKERPLTAKQMEYIKKEAYYGQELVARPYRLALMNMFLHDIEPHIKLGDSIYSTDINQEKLNCIITNPPFGSRGTIGVPKIRNFKVETSNIQINFIQHIYSVLKTNGRAAIVLPDSVLKDNKGRELWKNLIEDQHCNIHTILKLPKGTFSPYANGIKACVVFLQKGTETKHIWIYDARTGFDEINKTKRPLEYSTHFSDFVECYGEHSSGQGKRIESDNFECYSLAQIREKGYDLSFSKIYEPEKLESPTYYVDKLIENFEQQIQDLYKLKKLL